MPPRKTSSPIFVGVLKDGRLVYRDKASGRFASAVAYQAQFKPKRLTEEHKRKISEGMKKYWKEKKAEGKMWRCTLTCALYKSGQRDHKPEKKTVWAWAETKEEAEELAKKEYDKMASKFCGHKEWEEWNTPSVTTEEVAYDEKLIGTSEEQAEPSKALEQVEYNEKLVGTVKQGR